MDIFLKLTILMIVLELLEAYLHQADTLGEMIDNLYEYYKKSIFFLFLVHPTLYFIFIIFLFFESVNFYAIALLLLKVFDLFFKIELILQRYVHKNMESDLMEMLEMKMTPFISILGILIYVPLFFMAIYS